VDRLPPIIFKKRRLSFKNHHLFFKHLNYNLFITQTLFFYLFIYFSNSLIIISNFQIIILILLFILYNSDYSH